MEVLMCAERSEEEEEKNKRGLWDAHLAKEAGASYLFTSPSI